jgi:hypothetical protein
MEKNSEALSKHLKSLLSLDATTEDMEDSDDDSESGGLLTNNEILFYALQHDLPIFASIDGSLENGIATTSLSIVAPHILDSDEAQEWQHRPAKVLLTRSWRLPQKWGTSPSCINMAESIGLILGEYTIPSDLPVIYILDSNNSRTLQRKLCHLDEYTHRETVRNIRQGIESSIACHLEYLTSKWPRNAQLSQHAKELYARGEEICKLWAAQDTAPIMNSNDEDDNSVSSLPSWTDEIIDDNIDTPALDTNSMMTGKNRHRFDPTMYDCLERLILLKVYSHQLTSEFEIKDAGKIPKPNLFVVSANQFADNAASQAIRISNTFENADTDFSFYPPFSPRWCFSFEGRLTTKGATKLLREKFDEELILRLQERAKQGLFARLSPFTSLSADQIGDESILRSLLKMTAPCHTRCLYRYPPLANQIWNRWRDTQKEKCFYDRLSINVPKDWQKRPIICDYIIKACPFCSLANSTNNKKGNLEHLHLYCPCTPLEKARLYCNQHIEDALLTIYNFASSRQYNCSFQDSTRATTLQDNLERAAKEAELEERKIIRDSCVVYASRSTNKAIKSRAEINMDVLLNRLPSKKLIEYDKFPLSSRLGFMHAIPEKELDVAQATVTDVGFLGLFPKKILQELRNYAREIETENESNDDFIHLMNQLLHTFLYRPITIQKSIQILMAGFKAYLDELDEQRNPAADIAETTPCEEACPSSDIAQENVTHVSTPKSQIIEPKHDSPRKCYAIKCRLLQAKSILRGYKLCTTNRNTCSGCSNEASKQRLVKSLEHEMLRLSIDNAQLAPLLQHRNKPLSLKDFRKMVQFLPSLSKTSRNDHKFGASTYLANTIGVLLFPTASCRIMDEPISTRQTNNLWRQASFICRCTPNNDRRCQPCGIRSFCKTCDFIIPAQQAHKCPGCNTQDPWESSDDLCLSCQFATLTYRNPFYKRLERLIDEWLPPPSDSEDSIPTPVHCFPKMPGPLSPTSSSELTDAELTIMRTASYNDSFEEIRSRSSPEQNHYVIENITMLQRDLKKNSNIKRDITSVQSNSQKSGSLLDENLSPRKKPLTQRQLFIDDLSSSKELSYRIPLAPIDTNACNNDGTSTSSKTRWTHGSGKQIKRQERMLQAKEKRKEKRALNEG